MQKTEHPIISKSNSGLIRSKVVSVDGTQIGGDNANVVQSMLTADTMDTKACVEQCIRLVKAGCEIIRITAPSIKEAENLVNIKNLLHKKGYYTPLVADIHFTPNAAKIAAGIVEKIRINPGNFVKGKNLVKDEELGLIKEKLQPILEVCKSRGTVLRIGVNLGSLSERIMQEFGDTPMGMVKSAMEYLQICEELEFHEIVLSLKASNVKIMIEANRLMHEKMLERGKVYPLHLGVTEAGNGDDGRIKSAIGISSLLMDGIGDTIRVSLTEEPEAEIPVAKTIKERFPREIATKYTSSVSNTERKATDILNIGGEMHPIVIADFSGKEDVHVKDFFSVGHIFSRQSEKWMKADQACDYVYLGNTNPSCTAPENLGLISDFSEDFPYSENRFPLFDEKNFSESKLHPKLNFLKLRTDSIDLKKRASLKETDSLVLVLESDFPTYLYEERKIFKWLEQNQITLPVVLKRNYKVLDEERFLINCAADFGALLIDGFADGIWTNSESISVKKQNSVAFGILQATGDRISKTEYISCPSCGRAKFNVQQTKQKIEKVTSHLKGLKIGIMGCIVNGPGEMADADYGYVGSGNGKITLYKGKQIVQKDIPEQHATNALIELLKENGDWKSRKSMNKE